MHSHLFCKRQPVFWVAPSLRPICGARNYVQSLLSIGCTRTCFASVNQSCGLRSLCDLFAALALSFNLYDLFSALGDHRLVQALAGCNKSQTRSPDNGYIGRLQMPMAMCGLIGASFVDKRVQPADYEYILALGHTKIASTSNGS